MNDSSHLYESFKNKGVNKWPVMSSNEKRCFIDAHTKALVMGEYKMVLKAWWKHCWIMYSLEKQAFDF
jgi:hypothetical protein